VSERRGWFSSFNPRLRDWPAQRVWLVGASSGIGAALAKGLLERGARVALSARSVDALQALAQPHAGALVLAMDAANPQDWSDGHAKLCAAWGGVDLVIFCAAQYQPERSWQVRSERARSTIATNLSSVYFGLEAVLPAMIERGTGALAVVASVAGYMGLPNATVYGPTKAALINLAELLYLDLRPRGIGVYLINPGFVRTPLTALNDFPMPALILPEQAAERIVEGFERGRFEIDFPRRFTRVVRMLSRLPYRWRFAVLRRALGGMKS
jgi:short-subunit dehydrogenase